MPKIAAPNRVNTCFRIGINGLTWLDKMAYNHRVTRTEVFRAVLAYARTHETDLNRILEER